MIVRMWEVRAYPGHAAALLDWLAHTALPAVAAEPTHAGSEVFASADHRVVVLSRWRGEPGALPDPPAAWVARAPHSWDFTPVDL
ncbi:hypothetical protein GCM10010123_31360 [Pilimelia anulata]|uniref:ABM domain-containing protein n=1 Tax=Pilimelia anulata TaxID=53371 RepID=A0A8J3B6J2_9ACTN|nr:antibiotic biosynthesis monooxygenase [Pilimelia anulata]GGJ99143.1 hypothetical protein GCM10010123_31360 [Pilimelia anulata]